MHKNILLVIFGIGASGFLHGMEPEWKFRIKNERVLEIIVDSLYYQEREIISKDGGVEKAIVPYRTLISTKQLEAIDRARKIEGWPKRWPQCLTPLGQWYFDGEATESFETYLEKFQKNEKNKSRPHKSGFLISIRVAHLFGLLWGLRLQQHGDDPCSLFFTLKSRKRQAVNFSKALARTIYATRVINQHNIELIWEFRGSAFIPKKGYIKKDFDFIVLCSNGMGDGHNRTNYHIRIQEGEKTKQCDCAKNFSSSNEICPNTKILLKALGLPYEGEVWEKYKELNYRLFSDEAQGHCLGCSYYSKNPQSIIKKGS